MDDDSRAVIGQARPPSALANARGRPTAARVSDDVLLDAARRCVLASGLRRTTLAEIARTAKVSRMTLYRRFPDVRSVLSALMTREFGTLLHQATVSGADAPTARARLVRSSVAAVRLLNADPLMRTILDVDTALVVPYVLDRLGGTQRLGEKFIVALLEAGHRDGSIRRATTAVQARSVLLVVQSFVLSLRPATADVAAEALLSELAHHLNAALRPL
ncbi:TetR/AcrR family transcriptional regulator [Amycolatopsis thermophila]|uniref:AcrR family transcriptional regulator n=1 Tax=Amycolatopsis thermophila TaxID=206084 RepID=A0ABU0EVZ7_9PSEU|nr:TetR/AcrR family transcriptional regulator [Amycolatopsis thermophila]MDQ0378982.1 AcrR family transcriptional regulator [Amycolatopsis thermophila]